MSFRITGLAAEPFEHYFSMDDTDLRRVGAVRRVVDSKPGFPCRISLTDAEIGDEVLLINFEHLPTDSPYRSCHAIYIRRNEERFEATNGIPAMLRSRLLSVRAFDENDMMVDADVVDGADVEHVIAAQFANPESLYLHIHFAKYGCFAARVDRIENGAI
jgi:Protein of unknown function (DUF1203)